MPVVQPPLPARHPGLRIVPRGDGDHVIKDPRTGEFYQLGEEEHFLLTALDGEADATSVCTAFERRFGEPLPEDELQEFVEDAQERGLLMPRDEVEAERRRLATAPSACPKPKQQSVLFWRKGLWDPDRFFDRLEPRIRFFWTRGFFWFSGVSLVVAAALVWIARGDIVREAALAVRPETVFWGWIVLFLVTTLHECAHGLTCKHHGGEVHEIGVLFMYFMPCFYCNVSDAWLLPEKRKRLWITLAGAWFELFLWALAVFLWMVTATDTFLHRLAFVFVAVGGVNSFFNFNPLIKLDGYYLLSDWKEIPNLRERSFDRIKAHVRRLLWGARAPEPNPNGRFLTAFGLVSWFFSLVFVGVMLVGLSTWLRDSLGVAADILAAALAVPALRMLLRGVFAGEVSQMLFKRRKRALLWLLGLGGIAAALALVEVEEYSGGTFTVRPALHMEVRSPVAGFLHVINVDEGQAVTPQTQIAQLEVPELRSRLDQKRAELREAEAELRLLEAGPSPRVIREQEKRVQRAAKWCARAEANLERMKTTLVEELAALDQRIAESRVLQEAAETDYKQVSELFRSEIASLERLEEAEKERRVAEAQVARTLAERRARAAKGTMEAEDELALRNKELEDERAALALLEAGTRPERIDAQRARHDRISAEIKGLERMQQTLVIRAAATGRIVTPRLREQCGRYVREGELICTIEDPSQLIAEIALNEEKLQRVETGQRVKLKARALPFDSLHGEVTGIAPLATAGENAQSSVAVRCSIGECSSVLRTRMSGYARVYTGRRSIGGVLLDRARRLLKTEFWW